MHGKAKRVARPGYIALSSLVNNDEIDPIDACCTHSSSRTLELMNRIFYQFLLDVEELLPFNLPASALRSFNPTSNVSTMNEGDGYTKLVYLVPEIGCRNNVS